MPVKAIIHEKRPIEQVAFRLQTMHLIYKNGIWRTKLAFRLQICSFQFTNKHLVLQTGISDYNSALGVFFMRGGWKTRAEYAIFIKSLVKNLERYGMLRNNVELDLKTKFIEEGTTQTEIAEAIGVSLPYVNRITKGREQIVNKTFVKIMDELGYDVELVYKKKQ